MIARGIVMKKETGIDENERYDGGCSDDEFEKVNDGVKINIDA